MKSYGGKTPRTDCVGSQLFCTINTSWKKKKV